MTTFSDLLKTARTNKSYWESKIRHKFALLLSEELQNRNLTQGQFAALAGVSPAYMSRVLSGNENLSIKTFIKLTRSLDLIFDIDIQAAMPDFAQEPICAGGQDTVNWGLLDDLVHKKHGSPLFKNGREWSRERGW